MENRLRGRAKQVYDDIRAKFASQAIASPSPANEPQAQVSKRIQHEETGTHQYESAPDSSTVDDNKPYPADCKVAALSSLEAGGSALDYSEAQPVADSAQP